MKLECVNLKRFSDVLKAVKASTRKTEAEIVNRALKDVAYRCMSFSPYAEPGLIQAELYRDNILIKIATKRVKARAGKQKVDKYGNTKLTRKGTAQVHSNATRQAIAEEAAKILKRRIGSSRAIRAGWIPAVKAFGGGIRGAAKEKAGSSAAKGGAQKATIGKLVGIIRNALVTHPYRGGSVSVEDIAIATDALAKAVDFVASDRENHLRTKMIEKNLRKYSDK